MSAFENQSVADPKALKNMMAKFNTDDAINSLIKAAGNVIAMDRPRAVRFIDLLSSYCQKQPLLLNCTPNSLWTCMKTAANFGLEPGLLGMLYLVPFKNKGVYEAQVILGYRGLIELTRRSGAVKHIEAFNVYEADLKPPGHFEVILGLKPDIMHRPNWMVSHDGQRPVGSYCVSVLADGERTFTFMTQDEIEAIRKRSRAKDNGPWVTDPGEMYRKTATRRHCKYLPLSVEDLTLLDKARNADFDVDPLELETKGGIPISVTPSARQSLPAPAPAPAPAETSGPKESGKKGDKPTGTAGLKEALSKKQASKPEAGKKPGAGAAPPDGLFTEEGGAGQNPPPAPAPEAPKGPEWVFPSEEKTKESVDDRVLRYNKELKKADEMPTPVLTARANYCFDELSEADQKAVLKKLGMTPEEVKEKDTLKMRKDMIAACAKIVTNRKKREARAKAKADKEAGDKPNETPPPDSDGSEPSAEASEPTEPEPPAEASDGGNPIKVKVEALLEGYKEIDKETLRSRAKEILAIAKESVSAEQIKDWLYDLHLEESDIDICGQIGLRRILETFGKGLTEQ